MSDLYKCLSDSEVDELNDLRIILNSILDSSEPYYYSDEWIPQEGKSLYNRYVSLYRRCLHSNNSKYSRDDNTWGVAWVKRVNVSK